MSNIGFFKVYRKIIEWEWYTHPTTFRVFFHLIAIANHEDKKWRGQVIKRGQVVTSQDKIAVALGFVDKKNQPARQPIRTALSNLQKTNDITIKTTNKYSIITVNNYNKYQTSNQQNSKKVTNKKRKNNQQPNHQATTTKEYIKNNKNNILYSAIKDTYNKFCPSLPTCTRLSEGRIRMIKARLEEYKLTDFEIVFKNAEASEFLSGRSGDWGGCNFDWLIRPNNFLKVLEGTYKNVSKKKASKLQSHSYDFKKLERDLVTVGKKKYKD